jgi:hypothetical protein
MTTDPTATGGQVMQFRLAGVDVMTAGNRTGDPGQQVYKLTLKGPGGEIVMFDFGSAVPEIIATKQGPDFWLIECPLVEHEPFLAQLRAALNHAVDVRLEEFPNGTVNWQFTGQMI